MNLIKSLLLFILHTCIIVSYAQNSWVGDGFGGRLWYKPYNYSVGSYSAYTTCGDSQQLYAWGYNGFGQLGNGTRVSSATPVKVLGMTNTRYYSSGYCTAVIKQDHSGWIFGHNFTPFPTKVIDQVKFVNAGSLSCTFIKDDGTVWSIGQCQPFGTFGKGDTSSVIKLYNTPQKMYGINTAVRVANAPAATIILLKDGTVWSAGLNFRSNLLNIKDTFLIPRQLPVLKNIVDIKSSASTNIALDIHGDVYEWGDGKDSIPIKNTSLKHIVAISSRNDGGHNLAIDEDHKCYAWGNNCGGAFGCGITYSYISTPYLTSTDVNDILAAECYSYIIKKDASIWVSGLSLAGGSIYMDLDEKQRLFFEQMHPENWPMNLCPVMYAPVEIDRNFLICEGDSIHFGKHTYTTSGTWHDTISSNLGDSVVNITVTRFPRFIQTQKRMVCDGKGLLINGKIIYDPGFYSDTFSTIHGCDSIITTELRIEASNLTHVLISICNGDTTQLPINSSVSAHLFYDTLKNINGCDSVLDYSITRMPCGLRLYNVFTPNGDNLNDCFEITGPSDLKYDLYIYNRWGELVYQTTNAFIHANQNFWNGKVMNKGNECPNGTYYFLFYSNLEAHPINGIVELIH